MKYDDLFVYTMGGVILFLVWAWKKEFRVWMRARIERDALFRKLERRQ